MVLGVVIGLAAGLAIGVAWHMARSGPHGRRRTRLAEGRLADAQALTGAAGGRVEDGVGGGGGGRDGPRRRSLGAGAARARTEHEAARRAEEERSHLAGAFAELSAQALAKNNEQFLALAATKLNEVRTAAEGDLTQRQQAIAQLLDPLERDAGALRARVCGRWSWSARAPTRG